MDITMNESELNISLISHEFPPHMFGGIASNCFDLAYSLSKKNIKTTVYSGSSRIITRKKINDYLEVVYLPNFNLPPRFVWFQLQNIKIFRTMIDKHSVFHAVNPSSSAYCAILAKKYKKPLVSSIHWLPSLDLKTFLTAPFDYWTIGDFGFHVMEYPLTEFMQKTCINNSDHIIVHSLTTLNQIREINRDFNVKKASMIYNGINFDKINDIGFEATDKASDVTIIFFGRLFYRKGILHLINAIDKLRKDFPEVNLKIFGSGPLESKIQYLRKKMGLEHIIETYGHVPYADLIREIKKSDIVALPSLYEVGPFISALEAMACTKPVISFDLPFTREFIIHMYNGVLAEVGNVDDLSKKLNLLISDASVRKQIGKNAFEYVREKHNWNRLIDRYIEIYNELLA